MKILNINKDLDRKKNRQLFTVCVVSVLRVDPETAASVYELYQPLGDLSLRKATLG